jgi:type III secretory pathway component EscT
MTWAPQVADRLTFSWDRQPWIGCKELWLGVGLGLVVGMMYWMLSRLPYYKRVLYAEAF